MASSARFLSRVIRPSSFNNAIHSTAQARLSLARQNFECTARRHITSSSLPRYSSKGMIYAFGALGAIECAGLIYFSSSNQLPLRADAPPPTKTGGSQRPSSAGKEAGSFTPTAADYQDVYDAVAERLVGYDDYDDGSYGPVILRLGWHTSGTYDAETGTGGSNGATMRFAPESDHGANSGLMAARKFLEPVKKQFPWITYSDLWTLSSVCAIQEMAGPVIPWRPGRNDRDPAWCTPDGRLPDGAKGSDHLRAIFYRMGFNDQEIVALSGAHALGRCHKDRSGFDGPWTFSPITVTNDYYKLLMDEKWHGRKWDGPFQWQDQSMTLMMLPTDMALVEDKSFKPYVEKYAQDNDKFFEDFSNVLCKLFELGVPFTSKEDERMRLRPTSEA